ncbi:MAG TPA: glycerol-3-phosphate 1-O-acyltransferase PlsY [Gemmatimonadaceae bacterium]|nr:glycerol-3-phosphate 1-O-acyltransferase PlsY [Gemmatimonadaceae bacterium]
MHPAWGLVFGYVLGSIPFAYLAGRAWGVDLRQHGSGNLGATNAVRVLGARVGAVVYLLDTLKGFVAAFALPRMLGVEPGGVWAIAFGMAAVAGHVRPLFLRFQRGGKGVATAGGVFFGLAPLATAVTFVVFALVLAATGYASVGSMTAAVTLPLAIALLQRGASEELVVVAAAMAVFVFWSHRVNIGRLRRGEEHRFDILRRRRTPAPGRGN